MIASRNETLLTVVTVVLTMFAGVIGTKRLLQDKTTASAAVAVRPVPEWRLIAAFGHRMGAENAPVTVTMFSDFQCPYCKVAADDLKEIRSTTTVVYRHYPLQMHRHAHAAAVAAVCASRQSAFEALHDRLFLEQDSIGHKSWRSFALDAGVRDLRAFEECLAQPSASAWVAHDSAAAAHLRIRGTPFILVNGMAFEGSPGRAELHNAVEKARQKGGSD